jgi:DNA polymerase I-like protein with 3'-5' exonuclease and polymerase domains
MAWNDEGDETGLWWQNEPRVRATRDSALDAARLGELLRQMAFDVPEYEPPPLIRPPSGFVALDLETEDPDINTRGSSWAFKGRGQILGASVAWEGFSGYYSIGHRDGNLDPENVMAWLRDMMRRKDISIVCAYAGYDLGWMKRELDIYPEAIPHDVQFAAALLDESRLSYSLDSLARTYLGVGKEYQLLDEIAQRANCKRGELFSHLKQLPAKVIAPYAIVDAERTYQLNGVFQPKIDEEGLRDVYQMESELIPLSVEMRRRGIRVNVDAASQLLTDYRTEIISIQDRIKHRTGVHVEPWEAETCASALKEMGHQLPTTSTGKTSITKELLDQLANEGDEVAGSIRKLRQFSKACTTFLEGHILSYAENGRIHPTYNQLRRDDSGSEGGRGASMRGTVSGRYSVDSPNVQQLPIRDKGIGMAIRGIFEPEEGEQWCMIDYMAQEPRLQVEIAYRAKLPGAAEAMQAYIDNPRLDMHQWVADLCGIGRPEAKTINLGRAYGMSTATLALALGLSIKRMVVDRGRWRDLGDDEDVTLLPATANVVNVGGEETMKLLKVWGDKAPFITKFVNMAKEVADKRGYVKTIMGRRCRFVLSGGEYQWTHAAANRVIQGSAADQVKMAMLIMWREGIVPLITLHDELNNSVRSPDEARRIADIMETAIPLSVPMVCDPQLGSNWARAKAGV